MKLYNTGTESTKKVPPPSKTKDLRSLRDLDLCSTMSKIKKRKSTIVCSNNIIDSIMLELLSNNNNPNQRQVILKINKNINTLLQLSCDFCENNITTSQ